MSLISSQYKQPLYMQQKTLQMNIFKEEEEKESLYCQHQTKKQKLEKKKDQKYGKQQQKQHNSISEKQKLKSTFDNQHNINVQNQKEKDNQYKDEDEYIQGFAFKMPQQENLNEKNIKNKQQSNIHSQQQKRSSQKQKLTSQSPIDKRNIPIQQTFSFLQNFKLPQISSFLDISKKSNQKKYQQQPKLKRFTSPQVKYKQPIKKKIRIPKFIQFYQDQPPTLIDKKGKKQINKKFVVKMLEIQEYQNEKTLIKPQIQQQKQKNQQDDCMIIEKVKQKPNDNNFIDLQSSIQEISSQNQDKYYLPSKPKIMKKSGLKTVAFSQDIKVTNSMIQVMQRRGYTTVKHPDQQFDMLIVSAKLKPTKKLLIAIMQNKLVNSQNWIINQKKEMNCQICGYPWNRIKKSFGCQKKVFGKDRKKYYLSQDLRTQYLSLIIMGGGQVHKSINTVQKKNHTIIILNKSQNDKQFYIKNKNTNKWTFVSYKMIQMSILLGQQVIDKYKINDRFFQKINEREQH